MKPTLTLLTALLLASLAALHAADASRPNILLILADDLGYGDIACFRGDTPWTTYKPAQPEVKAPRTPNLDRLAAQGRMLTSFYDNCSVCSPSRAAMMTGRYNHRSGVVNVLGQLSSAMKQIGESFTGLQKSEITVAGLLKANGYRTACFGKWHLGNLEEHHPLDFGFDQYVGDKYGGGDNFSVKDAKGKSFFYRNRDAVDAPGYWYTDVLIDETISYITQSAEKPFFAYLALTTPHTPYIGPNDKELANAWDKKGGKGPRKDFYRAYVDVVEGMDASLGRLFQTLEKSGLADNTLVIFTSDNGATGCGSSAPLRGRKCELYEGGTRVPFIAHWPGHIPSGSSADSPAMGMDLLPTFAALAGAPLPTGRKIDGVNLSTLLTAGTALSPRMLFWEKPNDVWMDKFYLRRWAVRDGKWKIQQDPINKELALYDLSADPTESSNVAAGHPEIVQRLEQAFQAWRKDVYSDCPYNIDQVIERMKNDPKIMSGSTKAE
jgi:arylsulfatase A